MKELLETIKDRVRSPIVGPFIAAFIVTNWEPLSVFAFSKLEIVERILFIKQNYFGYEHTILYPLAFASAYVFTIPVLTGAVSMYQHMIDNRRILSEIGRDAKVELKKIDIEAQVQGVKSRVTVHEKRRELAELEEQIKLSGAELLKVDALRALEAKIREAKTAVSMTEEEMRNRLTLTDKKKLKKILQQ